MQIASYDPDQDFEELEGEEAQCSNCYHEEDFPHETLVLNNILSRLCVCTVIDNT